MKKSAWIVAACLGLGACDGGSDSNAAEPPLALTTDLCDDPANMAALADSLGDGEDPPYGQTNLDQFARMAQAPTEGPFYMVNLIKFNAQAQYPDGRETDLTGREANALYSPSEFLDAIGARVVFVGDVDSTTLGTDGTWDQIAIVEYPCPVALFAMSAHPEFQERSIHKDAGLESSTVMVTHLQPSSAVEATANPFPSTAGDPAFDHVQVFRYRSQADYEPGSSEPARTGQEAIDLYSMEIRDTQLANGIVPKVRLAVQGVFIGDGRSWDEVWIDDVPSQAAFGAVGATGTVVAAQVHREAAIDDGFGVTTQPLISSFPGEAGGLPAVAPDGTGTICMTDADCPGNGVDRCLNASGTGGFCTREGCGAGECESPYLCCRACSPAVVAMLPFDGSACLPGDAVGALTTGPASCTCD